jgi:hypothetical protein
MKVAHIVTMLASLFFIFFGYLYAFRPERVVRWMQKENDKSIISGTFLGSLSNAIIRSHSYSLSLQVGGYAAILVGTMLLSALVTGLLDG